MAPRTSPAAALASTRRRRWADIDEDSDDASDMCILELGVAVGKEISVDDSGNSTEADGDASETSCPRSPKMEGEDSINSLCEAPLAMKDQKTRWAPESLGSMEHGRGKCKPCLFFSTPDGCAAGEHCRFCHKPHEVGDTRRPCKSRRDLIRKLQQRNQESLAQQQGQQGQREGGGDGVAQTM
eukprot:CAMPEP_0176098596 /NCGR_PEP_ID=MMETSP0120_2-20121206/49438_1 /TAXON_ID=160619 /ORGANISM="Kryptoperidinium foliaceum, Strain CCMP 1326" /LENGTH=182 /DNA_ID=CAMNT_0017432609 /DNA_START=59 /DNA_END=607 /DNA_ORIENTATION=-